MKKIILIILVTTMLLGILSACTKAEISNENLNIGNGTSNSEASQTSEPTLGITESDSIYQPGEWTTGGYTSEWLNMSYERPWVWELTEDSISISKQFDELRKADDPYFAVTEMYFNSIYENGITSGGLITLQVGLMENGDKTVRECADEDERTLQEGYEEWGTEREILVKKEAEIIFLGEKYLVRYTKYKVLGKMWEACTLYLVKDNHLVRLTNNHLSNDFSLNNTFKGFSALNGDDYKGICSICDKEIIYEVVDTDGTFCLECCFDGHYAKQPENDQTKQETTAPTTPFTQAPTEKPTTAPTETPATCNHSYEAATCTAPRTCTKCGVTEGSAVGHSWSAVTCTEPKTCTVCGATSGSAAGHKWTNITQTVHHDEQGHYEDAEVAKSVQKVKCYACSHKTDTLEEYYSHFDGVHGNNSHYLLVRERYEMVDDWIYETVTVWVVDKEAYTETVITGQKCDVCGKTE